MKIYNSLTNQKEDFIPLESGKVKIYACGITVSDNAHIGHAYQAVIFDMITRYLEYKGFDVLYVRNYTDVDDKIIAKANEVGEDAIKYAQKYIEKTDREFIALGNKVPTFQPRVTENITEIINFIQKLIDKGFAYSSSEGNVYFCLKKFNSYGQLSKIKIDENKTAVRKDLEPGKIDDADFALWKSAKPCEISWESPWGFGRPGWHIECSAMNLKYLGEQIDIHGGGRDLIFPHHENEVAQTEALTGKQFSKYWVHCGLVKVNGQKMGKSLGNGILLQDVLNEYDTDVIRFAILRNSYSSDLDISDKLFPESIKHIYKFYSVLSDVTKYEQNGFDENKTKKFIDNFVSEFESAMDNDFNTSVAFAEIFRVFAFLSSEMQNKNTEYNLKEIASKLKEILGVFNILQRNPDEYIQSVRNEWLGQNDITKEEIENFITERAIAKSNKDFITSDKIRDDLKSKGIFLKDSANETMWNILI